MPNYLKEADWKAVLEKPKNLGLKAQKTGISEKLRDLDKAEKAFHNADDITNADKVLSALTQLKSTAEAQSKKHKAFSEATAYMTEIVKACGVRTGVVNQKKVEINGLIQLLAEMKETCETALKLLDVITSAATFKNKSGGSLHECIVKLMKAGKFKAVKGGDMATLNNRLMADLDKATDENLKERKADVKKALGNVKAQLASAKVTELSGY